MQFTFSYIDLIVIGVLCFTTYYGKKRGIIISAYNFCSYFITYFLTKVLQTPFATYLKTTDLSNKIYDSVFNKLDVKDVVNEQVYTSGQQFLNDLGLPDFIVNILSESVDFDAYTTFNLDTYRSLIALSIRDTVLSIIAFITVFIGVIIAVKVVGMILNIVSKLPIVSNVDSLGGGIFGFLNGSVFIFIAFLFVSAILIFSMPTGSKNAFDNSFFYNWFLSLNFFQDFIIKVVS